MRKIEVAIVVNRPVTTVYNQWTQFEAFPEFMSGVLEAHQVDDTHVRWKVSVGGRLEEWSSEITEQVPDRRISWKSVAGAPNAGTVRFKPLGKDRTEVRLVMAYQPRGAYESIGALFGPVRARAVQALREFKTFTETHFFETGAWRGEVVHGEAHRPPVVHSREGWPLLS
jgi:uncharacterized membrane protein